MTETRQNKSHLDLRDRINALALIEALERHVLDNEKMSATQVSAALALLKKILPDLSGVRKPASEREGVSAHEDALKELE